MNVDSIWIRIASGPAYAVWIRHFAEAAVLTSLRVSRPRRFRPL